MLDIFESHITVNIIEMDYGVFAVRKFGAIQAAPGKMRGQLGDGDAVKLMFEDMVESWFPEESSSYENFKQSMLLGEIDYMNQYMNQVALQTFSSFDVGKKPSEHTEPERFYHGLVLGLIVDLADKYRIKN